MNSQSSIAKCIATSIASEHCHATQRNERTNGQVTHLSDKWSPSVTHTRVSTLMSMVGNRARYALLSEVTA